MDLAVYSECLGWKTGSGSRLSETIPNRNRNQNQPPGVLSSLSDRSASASALKIEALAFLQPLLWGGDPALLGPHLKALSGGLFGCVGERYYKVSGLLSGCGGGANAKCLVGVSAGLGLPVSRSAC